MRANPLSRPVSFSLSILCCTTFLWGCTTPDPSPSSSASPQVQVTSSPAASASDTSVATESGSNQTQSATTKTTTQSAEANGRQVAEPQTVLGNREKGGEFLQKANFERGTNNYAAAAELYNEALMADPKNYNIPFEGGCNFALWGKNDLALETLHVAADLGYPDSDALDSNVALDSLRENPRFDKLKAKVEANRGR